jgi:hypothetical protein
VGREGRVVERGRAFRSPKAFRDWLRRNHGSASELVVRCYKTRPSEGHVPPGLDEASPSGGSTACGAVGEHLRGRFRPEGGRLGEVNLKRPRSRAEGRMQPAGLAALRRREPPTYSYESAPRALNGAFLERFRAAPEAWRFFQSQPEGYRRTCAFWVMSARRPATREARFGVLLASSGAGERIPLLRR